MKLKSNLPDNYTGWEGDVAYMQRKGGFLDTSLVPSLISLLSRRKCLKVRKKQVKGEQKLRSEVRFPGKA